MLYPFRYLIVGCLAALLLTLLSGCDDQAEDSPHYVNAPEPTSKIKRQIEILTAHSSVQLRRKSNSNSLPCTYVFGYDEKDIQTVEISLQTSENDWMLMGPTIHFFPRENPKIVAGQTPDVGTYLTYRTVKYEER